MINGLNGVRRNPMPSCGDGKHMVTAGLHPLHGHDSPYAIEAMNSTVLTPNNKEVVTIDVSRTCTGAEYSSNAAV